jgi:hypothetical protein
LLVTEKWQWYGKDIISPMLGAIAIAWLCVWVQPGVETKLVWLVWLLATGIFMVSGAWIASGSSNLYKFFSF